MLGIIKHSVRTAIVGPCYSFTLRTPHASDLKTLKYAKVARVLYFLQYFYSYTPRHLRTTRAVI